MNGKRERAFEFERWLTDINHRKKEVKCAAGRRLFWQGDRADAVFYRRQSKTELAVTSKQGKEAVLGILDRGTFIGEGCLVGRSSWLDLLLRCN